MWNIVWQVDPDTLSSCIERDWLADLLSLVPINSAIVDFDRKPGLSVIAPHSIVCASSPNQTSAIDLIAYLKRIPKPRVLYHMSDEYLEVGADVYAHCELIIRNGSARFELFDDPRFVQVPLGYASELGNAGTNYAPSSLRKCSFIFLGAMKHEREAEMLPALQRLEGPHFLRRTTSFEAATRLFDRSTIMLYKNAVFVPNPKGNWSPECNRMYDALEWGCIPLIKRYADTPYHEDYHDKLFGDHPIPTFDTWSEASDFAGAMLADPVKLDALQYDVTNWWRGYKSSLRILVAEKLATLL